MRHGFYRRVCAVQHALAPATLWDLTARRSASSSQPVDGQRSVAVAARREPAPEVVVDNSRIIETELRSEAERSYLSVRHRG